MTTNYTNKDLVNITRLLSEAFRTAAEKDIYLLMALSSAANAQQELMRDAWSPAAAKDLDPVRDRDLITLTAFDKVFEVVTTECGEDIVRYYIPPAHQTGEISAAFAQRDLKTLAKIYAPK